MSTASWRQGFVELCEAIFRELGFDPPPMLHEDALPLAMELEVEQRSFELIHSSTDRPEKILIICHLGPLPDDAGKLHFNALLSENIHNIRDFRPCFGINADSHEAVSISYENLNNLRAAAMLEKMRALASEAENWQELVFSPQYGFDDHATEISGVTLA
jgi:hypothetical protein